MTSLATETLSRPFTLGGLTLRNRLVMAPMTRQFSPDGVPGENVASYYARRAAANVGLIITEGTYVGHPSAGESGQIPLFDGEEPLAGWRRIAEDVHAAGGRIIPQLWHVGMVRKPGQLPHADASPMGPSGIRLDGTRETNHTMSSADIDAVVEAFADAAAQAERIGFDGVEIHGAHGYLIDQFLWSGTNRRTDGYGGDLASRTRFAAEITAAVRAAVSPEFPVIFRLSQWKLDNYDARISENPKDLETILSLLSEAGADAFHCSTRRFWLPEFDGSDLNLAGWAKKLSGLPTITVGSVGLDNDFISGFQGESAAVTSVDNLITRLEREEFDLVAVGRALLGDPEWVAKLLEGRTDEMTPYTPDQLATLS
ncbi:NADH:flavin oxidoreductase [Streptomyces sp. NPDC059215]|uniref:NADH:flavin oxidoreductase n=1 Tax=Streptomyces sp. NPDC059215 TaxID=3346772 RepID=UPI0036CBF6B4